MKCTYHVRKDCRKSIALGSSWGSFSTYSTAFSDRDTPMSSVTSGKDTSPACNTLLNDSRKYATSPNSILEGREILWASLSWYMLNKTFQNEHEIDIHGTELHGEVGTLTSHKAMKKKIRPSSARDHTLPEYRACVTTTHERGTRPHIGSTAPSKTK